MLGPAVASPILLVIAAATPTAQNGSRYEAFAFSSKGHLVGPLTLTALPSQATVRRLLAPETNYAYRVRWDCGLGPSGRLIDCQVQAAWPKKLDLKVVSARITPQFRVEIRQARELEPNHVRVFVEALLNDSSRKLNMNCPPGWCPGAPPASRP